MKRANLAAEAARNVGGRMSDKNSLGWGRLFEELKNPWDWAAGIGGAAVGSVGTVASHFTDLGHSIPAVGLGAIFARRAGVASCSRWMLGKKANALQASLKETNDLDLIELLAFYKNTWGRRQTSNDEFSEHMKELTNQQEVRAKQRIAPQMLSSARKSGDGDF